MKIIILGAGIIGVSTAWHLLEQGHEVTVVERQPDAAMETSFANAAQISVSYCEPRANRDAPLKALKRMFLNDALLLFRPKLDWQQWRWSLQFLSQCNDAAFERNVQQLVALGAYSHAALKDVVRATGIEYERLEHGIAHYYTDQKSFDTAGDAAALMRQYGVSRRVVNRDELLRIEPAFGQFAHRIVGGTYTASDESGDARVFTQALAKRCITRGAEFLYSHDVVRLQKTGSAIDSVAIRARSTRANGQNDQGPLRQLKADQFVVACGSYTAPLLRTVGVDLPIYPGKGYSATFKILRPELAPRISTIDDEMKITILWVNAGHGTLGWTHGAGSGKALAELISGRRPAMNFGFHGFAATRAAG
jgi:D-amino-acid dehydrogenase